MHVVLTRSQHERLRARAAASGRSVGSVIRDAIDRELGREAGGATRALASGAGTRLLAAGTIAGVEGP